MIQVYLTNLGKYSNEGCLIGKFIKLPIKEEHFEKALKEIGIDGVEYEEYFITDVESDISGLSEVITEYTSIKVLNGLAERLEELSESDTDKLSAILESERKSSISDILDTIDTAKIAVVYKQAIGLGYSLFAAKSVGFDYSCAFATAKKRLSRAIFLFLQCPSKTLLKVWVTLCPKLPRKLRKVCLTEIS